MKEKQRKVRRDAKAMTAFFTSVVLCIVALYFAFKMNYIWIFFAVASVIAIGLAIFRAEKLFKS